MVDYVKHESLIRGLIAVKIGDMGPELVANLSDIDDEDALITALHLVSLQGLEEELNSDESRILGPFPVKSNSQYRALYYSTMMTASGAEDERLIEHGAKIGVILLFNTDKLPDIRRASGLIEPYLKLFLTKITESSQFDRKFAFDLFNHIIEIISRPRIRIFSVENEGIREYLDPSFIKHDDSIMILDESEHKMYLIVKKGISPFDLRSLRQQVDSANLSLFQGKFQVVRLETLSEIQPLLSKHGITIH